MNILNKNLTVFLLLFVIALLPRLYHLDQTTIYPDEISWMVRGKETLYAASKLNLNYFNSVWWNDPREHESIALPLILSNAPTQLILGKNPSNLSLKFFADYTAARIPIAILSSLLIPLFYLLAKRFVDPKIAFLFSVLFAFDPVHLALSRWVMNDGLLTLFTFSAIFFFMLHKKGKLFLILTSFSLAAGCLTRPTAVIVGVPLALLSLTKTKSFNKNLLLLISTLVLTYLLIWVLWPGLWDKPLTSYAEYFYREATLAQQGITVYYMGNITTNPPITYYLFELATRLPLPIVILVALSPIILTTKIFRKKILISDLHRYLPQISFFSFAAIFLLALSFSALKIGVRYALPTWPWIYLLAAWTASEIFKSLNRKWLQSSLVLILIISSVITLIKYFPDYYFFYNNLVGGPGNAQKYDLVGNCLGTKNALKYIWNKYPDLPPVAVIGCSNVTASYYYQGKISEDWQKEKIVVVENTLFQLSPELESVRYFRSQKPIYQSTFNGAILANVYLKEETER